MYCSLLYALFHFSLRMLGNVVELIIINIEQLNFLLDYLHYYVTNNLKKLTMQTLEHQKALKI